MKVVPLKIMEETNQKERKERKKKKDRELPPIIFLMLVTDSPSPLPHCIYFSFVL